MARADLLVSLVRAGVRGDPTQFRRTVEAIAAEERAKQHHVLADRLAEIVGANGSQAPRTHVTNGSQVDSLLYEVTPRRVLDELILSGDSRATLQEVIEEHQRVELLRSHALEPRHRTLLVGPPGNGKTTAAEALAEALMVPLLIVRYEGLIGSYLGETAQRLRRVFDHVRMRHCVLFLDEFDTLGKERGDVHETGEIKRVVSSLLLQIDDLPSHVLVVAATNHPELLDRAVWRRFQVRIDLPPPVAEQIEEWFGRFEQAIGERLHPSPSQLASVLAGASFAELEEFCADVMRRRVLDSPAADVQAIMGSRIAQWTARYRPPTS